MMKRTILILLALSPYLLFAQPRMKNKKYQGLLWEITGKGMKKPSYLFGTMHVSNKLAFHLADSFYVGIRNADVVALETNPESWQEDMSKYDLAENDYRGYAGAGYIQMPQDYLGINTLRFYKYDKKIERGLHSNPSTINNLLYRSYGNGSSDFEEDTYLDMYIYQCGKKWGKKVAGVENYDESMKLMTEAYRDAAKDKDKKERSYDAEETYSANKLQEAYRAGNLDWLDSINKYNSFSAAFDEKFLYRRNEIQAASIDSILRSGHSLFVGVGAAHLPGDRGVIEMLREQGYTLRPVKMGARDSQHKSQVEQLRVPVKFTNQVADDGSYQVQIPGKFYKFGEESSLDQRQYADMANGSYYMTTRIMTNAWMWGHDKKRVQRIIDSLLYENIPGKIVSKKAITRNGFAGIDITNKTRRGDMQRYNIFTTPFEVIIFKMSGTGDYVIKGTEAQQFFGSIQLKEYNTATEWKKYSPSYGGFSIELPHEPFIGNDGSWIYDAEDKIAQVQYRIVRTDIHNYRFAEEDSFDLALLEESFSSSEFIDKIVTRKLGNFKGYPALDVQYKDKWGGFYWVKFIIQGPHYYTLAAHGKQETAAIRKFLQSFEVKPVQYGKPQEITDTSLYFTVTTPYYPPAPKEKLDMPRYNSGNDEDNDELMTGGVFRSKIISNDTTGEKIYVSFYKLRKYVHLEDSSIIDRNSQTVFFGDSSWIVRSRKIYELPDKMKVWETMLSDTNSSRLIWNKSYYKDGIGYSLLSQSDTLTGPGNFIRSFYDNFRPADTLKGTDPFSRKSYMFFQDFASSDSLAHKRALKGMFMIRMDSTDFLPLKKIIQSLNWNEKKYLETKESLVEKLETIKTRQASDFLKELYYAAGDTMQLQMTVLETLLKQQTSYAFTTFRDIMIAEPPVLNLTRSGLYSSVNSYRTVSPGSYGNSEFTGELFDSLSLTRTIFSDLLPLIELDDYKPSLLSLLGQLVDSNLIKAKDYEVYYNKFYLEAKQELKRQSILEKQTAIRLAELRKEDPSDRDDDDDEDEDAGNYTLQLYARLLMPFWDSKPAVPLLIKQMIQSSDKQLKYSTLLLLMQNKKNYPDTLITYFAGLDEYRYRLYQSMKEMDKLKLFPDKQHNPIEIGRSFLLARKSYDKPDSVIYINRLPAEIKDQKGFVYFFKYKTKKDDSFWKIASVGLVKETKNGFILMGEDSKSSLYSEYDEENEADLSGFGNKKLKEEEAIIPQLQKELKRLIYSTRNSGKEFYRNASDSEFDLDSLSQMVETGN